MRYAATIKLGGLALAMAGILAFCNDASAQDPPAGSTVVVPPQQPVTQPLIIEHERSRPVMLETDLQIGAAGFTGNLGSRTNVGPAYGLRVGTSLYKMLSISGHYFGTANSVEGGGGLGTNAVLSNGLDLQIRVAPLSFFRVTPYAFVGLGATYINSVANRGNEFAAMAGGWSGQTPLGGGVMVIPSRFFAIGVEGAYNFLWQRDFTVAGPATNDTNIWSVTANLNFYL